MADDFYPFVENGLSPDGADIAKPPTSARIAVYDDMVMPPRVVMVEPTDIRSFLAEITRTVYELAIQFCGIWSFQVIRELVENLIHASFMEPTISILDRGKTIVFCDQGPGIPNKQAALKPSFSSATSSMKRYIRGVGSGLPIVEEWLRLHHGSLTIEDNLGRGTTITVSLLEKDEPSQTRGAENGNVTVVDRPPTMMGQPGSWPNPFGPYFAPQAGYPQQPYGYQQPYYGQDPALVGYYPQQGYPPAGYQHQPYQQNGYRPGYQQFGYRQDGRPVGRGADQPGYPQEDRGDNPYSPAGYSQAESVQQPYAPYGAQGGAPTQQHSFPSRPNDPRQAGLSHNAQPSQRTETAQTPQNYAIPQYYGDFQTPRDENGFSRDMQARPEELQNAPSAYSGYQQRADYRPCSEYQNVDNRTPAHWQGSNFIDNSSREARSDAPPRANGGDMQRISSTTWINNNNPHQQASTPTQPMNVSRETFPTSTIGERTPAASEGAASRQSTDERIVEQNPAPAKAVTKHPAGIDAHVPLTRDQRDVLMLYARLEKIGPKELGEQLGIASATGSRKLKEISSAGYIVKKGQKYVLTGEGQRMLAFLMDKEG